MPVQPFLKALYGRTDMRRRGNTYFAAGSDPLPFIPAGNEPDSHVCMDIWRLPQGSNVPLSAAGYLILKQVWERGRKQCLY